MRPEAKMSSGQVASAVGIWIPASGPDLVTMILNVTFANNTIDEIPCYVMIDGVCMDEEMGLR